MKPNIIFFLVVLLLPGVLPGQLSHSNTGHTPLKEPDAFNASPCDTPSVLSCGQTPLYGSTIGQNSQFFAISYLGCFVTLVWMYDAPDKLYKFTLTKPTEVNISLTILSAGANLDLFLLSSCQPANCIAYSTQGGNQDSIKIQLGPGDYYVVVDGKFGAQGDFNIRLSCDVETSVCDFGGTLINRSDRFSGSFDASDRAPKSLYKYQQVIDAYGGNIPQSLYADIYVFYGGKPTSISFAPGDPSVKLFVFVCEHCAEDGEPPIGTCSQANCISEEFCWWPTIPYSGPPYANPCSDYYYIVITGTLGASYSNLNIAPSWNCPQPIQDAIACGMTVTGTVSSGGGIFDTEGQAYKRCYNGSRLYEGSEKYYRLVLSQPSKITFDLSADGPMGMFLYSFMCGANCLGYAENTALSSNASFTATLSEGVYYLALDTEADGSDAAFSLNANCEQYSPFVDAQTFLSGNFSACPTNPAVSHQVNIAYDPVYAPFDYFNFYFRDTDGKLKGNTEASQYWHNSTQPMPFQIKGDLTGDAVKCSYAPGDSFYVFIHQTENGKRTFKRFAPDFAPGGTPAVFQAGGFSQITKLTGVSIVSFGAETSFLSVSPDSITIPLPFVTNLQWAVEKVNDPASWLTVNPAQSNGAKTLKLHFTANAGALPRSVVLRFYATENPDLYRQFVKVEQQGQCIVPQKVVIVPSATSVCLGTSLSLTADVGAQYQGLYNYLWSTGDTQPSIVVTPSSPGTSNYSVTVTNKYCFTTSLDDQPITVVSSNGFSAAISATAFIKCNGGSDGALTATATGGTGSLTFIWSNGQTIQTISNLSAGTYSVTVTDGGGCQDVKTYELKEPDAISMANYSIINASNNQNNGSVTVQMSGGTPGYTYQWMKADNTPLVGQTQSTLAAVFPGEYKVRVTDANGCVFTSSVFKVENTVATNDPALAAQIAVYPNPSAGKLYLRFALPARMEIEIGVYDALGREVLRANPGAMQDDLLEFDLSEMASGLYLLKINAESSWVSKIISIKK